MTVDDRLRAWARGILPLEAGTELLIRHGRTVWDGAPWIIEGRGIASIDVDALLDGTAAHSGGERRIVRIAASLLGGPAVDLNDDLPGLDREGLTLVLAAIAHAGGSHQQSGTVTDEAGKPVRFEQLPELVGWPED